MPDQKLDPDNARKKLNTYARYSGMGFQMAVTIGLGIWLGMYLDRRMNNETPYMTALCALLFMGLSLYSIIRNA